MLLQEVVVVLAVAGLLVVHLTREETDLMIRRMDQKMVKGMVGSVDTAKVVVVEVTLVDLPMVRQVMWNNAQRGSMTAIAEQVVGKLPFHVFYFWLLPCLISAVCDFVLT